MMCTSKQDAHTLSGVHAFNLEDENLLTVACQIKIAITHCKCTLIWRYTYFRMLIPKCVYNLEAEINFSLDDSKQLRRNVSLIVILNEKSAYVWPSIDPRGGNRSPLK